MKAAVVLSLLSVTVLLGCAADKGKLARATAPSAAIAVPQPPRCASHQAELPSGAVSREPSDHSALPADRRVKALCVDRGEVTVSDYQRCVSAAVCAPAGCASGPPPIDAPIACATWHDADTYCRWRGMRLPTVLEREWIRREAGMSLEPRCGCNGTTAPCRVGASGDATTQGVTDISGNVAEWTSSPVAASDEPRHWVAGRDFLHSCQSAEPTLTPLRDAVRLPTVGFRCVAFATKGLVP